MQLDAFARLLHSPYGAGLGLYLRQPLTSMAAFPGGMLMDLVSLLIQLVSGAVGGNFLGALVRSLSLGPFGNTLAGLVGGGLGGQVFDSVLGTSRIVASNGLDAGIIITEIVGGGIGGAALTFAVGLLRQWLPK